MSSILSKEQKILDEIENLKNENNDLGKELVSKELIIENLNNSNIQLSTENTELKKSNQNLITNCQQLLSTNQTYETTIQNQQKKIKEKEILIKEYERVISNILDKLNIKDESVANTSESRTINTK